MTYLLDASAYIPLGFVASTLFLIIYEKRLRAKAEQVFWLHRIVFLLLGLYLTVVFSLTVSPVYGFSLANTGNSVNLTPLHALHEMNINPMNFWGNILLFIPFGILSVLLSYRCRKFYVTLLMGIALSILIEVLQLFGTRGTDIDDVILNAAGTLCGYYLGKLLLWVAPSLHKKVGVKLMNDGECCGTGNDAVSIAILAAIILISVFVSGFIIKWLSCI